MSFRHSTARLTCSAIIDGGVLRVGHRRRHDRMLEVGRLNGGSWSRRLGNELGECAEKAVGHFVAIRWSIGHRSA